MYKVTSATEGKKILYREPYYKRKKHGVAVNYTYVTLRNSVLVRLTYFVE